jgi:hypothetical protein
MVIRITNYLKKHSDAQKPGVEVQMVLTHVVCKFRLQAEKRAERELRRSLSSIKFCRSIGFIRPGATPFWRCATLHTLD